MARGRLRGRASLHAVPGRTPGIAEHRAAPAAVHGRRGAGRAALRGEPSGRADLLDLRLRPVGRPRAGRGEPRRGRAAVHRDLHGRVGRAVRERPVQRARPARRAGLASGLRAARLRQVPAPGGAAVQPGLRGAGGAGQRPHLRRARAAVRGQARSGAAVRAHRRGAAPAGRGRGGDGGRGDEPGRRPDPARHAVAGAGDAAHQPLGDRRERRAPAVPGAQARPPRHCRAAPAPPAVRGVRLLPAGGGRAPAIRRGGARWVALVGPPGGLPHRGAGPGQGASRQERRHRARRSEGRVRAQAAAHADRGRSGRPRGAAGRGHCLLPDVHCGPARRHRQPRPGLGDRAAAGGGGASRRRRHLPRRRRRQGHRDVLRHRQLRRRRLRLLAGRRVRLRRLGGLRPQGHGHHGQGRVGEREAALPRARGGHPEPEVHRRRCRRHERGRVRQRNAAEPTHPAGRRLRPPPRVPRPGPGGRHLVRRAPAGVRPAPQLVGRLRRLADQRRRRGLPEDAQVGPDHPADPSCARPRRRRRAPVAVRARARSAARARGPALERRYRHLREVRGRDARRGGRQGQRRAAGQRQPATREGGGGGRQPRSHPARAHRVRPRGRKDQH